MTLDSDKAAVNEPQNATPSSSAAATVKTYTFVLDSGLKETFTDPDEGVMWCFNEIAVDDALVDIIVGPVV